MFEQPYWQTHNLPKPIYTGGYSRIKMSFYNSSDGWFDIDYTEFSQRVEQRGLSVAAETTRLHEGYEIRLGNCVCVLAELVEQMDEKRNRKGRKAPASAPVVKRYEPEEIYKQISLF